MADFKMNGFEEVMDQIKRLENPYELARECIDTATPILEGEMKGAIDAAATRGYSKGELSRSVKPTKAKENDLGVFAAVRATGTDSKGESNAKKLGILHYGSSRQSATGCITKAVASAEGKCLEAMQRKFNERTGAE